LDDGVGRYLGSSEPFNLSRWIGWTYGLDERGAQEDPNDNCFSGQWAIVVNNQVEEDQQVRGGSELLNLAGPIPRYNRPFLVDWRILNILSAVGKGSKWRTISPGLSMHFLD
jgi:hypothetical protein